MKIRFNNIQAQIVFENDQEREIFIRARAFSSVMAPGALYTYKYRLFKRSKGKQGWNGKVNPIEANGKFNTGLLPYVLEKLWEEKITPSLVDERPNFSYLTDDITVSLRDYQREAISAAVTNELFGTWWPRGVIKVATGGGKTEMAVAMYQYIPVQTLFLVHRKDLVYQAINRFKGYGINAGQLGDGVCDIKPVGITVATVQTIGSYLKRGKQELSFLSNIKQVFFDEAHLIAASIDKGNLFTNISTLLPNAFMRWGLTATPFMKDSYSNWLLAGATGELLYEVSNKTLIDKGYLTPPKVKVYNMPKFGKVSNTWPACYDEGIILNNQRNDKIAEVFKTLPKPCLIMCNQVSHAAIIHNRIFKYNKKIDILTGQDDAQTRQITITALRNGNIDGVICTTIFDEGVDIPELRSIILAGAGKSNVKQLQKIGRGLRRATGKREVIVVDFYDKCQKILEAHSKKRIEVWEQESFEVEYANV